MNTNNTNQIVQITEKNKNGYICNIRYINLKINYS